MGVTVRVGGCVNGCNSYSSSRRHPWWQNDVKRGFMLPSTQRVDANQQLAVSIERPLNVHWPVVVSARHHQSLFGDCTTVIVAGKPAATASVGLASPADTTFSPLKMSF